MNPGAERWESIHWLDQLAKSEGLHYDVLLAEIACGKREVSDELKWHYETVTGRKVQ